MLPLRVALLVTFDLKADIQTIGDRNHHYTRATRGDKKHWKNTLGLNIRPDYCFCRFSLLATDFGDSLVLVSSKLGVLGAFQLWIYSGVISGCPPKLISPVMLQVATAHTHSSTDTVLQMLMHFSPIINF